MEKKDEKEKKRSERKWGEAAVVLIVFIMIYDSFKKSYLQLKHDIKTRNYKKLAITAVLTIVFLIIYYMYFYKSS